MNEQHYELVVIGAGAGGQATALAAARLGVRTLLIERDEEIGGTAVRAGVSIWEPSVSGTGIAREIYQRLTQLPDAVGIYSFGHHCAWPTPGSPSYPGGELVIDPSRGYADTLRRYGAPAPGMPEAYCREHWHGVVCEPAALVSVVRALLAETGCCTVWTDATVTEVDAEDGVVRAATVRHGGEVVRVTAAAWVDASSEVAFCRQLGCPVMLGSEGRDVFGEPDAPPVSSTSINGVTLIYRLTRDQSAWRLPPSEPPQTCWWRSEFPVACVGEFPNGDWQVNMLPTMEGEAYLRLTPDAAYEECCRRVWAHWRWLRAAWPAFAEYGIGWIAPRLGVREGPRVVSEYILTELDLLAGLSGQTHADIIAIADHPVDLHGSVHRSGCQELQEPYGIPYRCLIPRGWRNLLVACHGAGFSHIAAASCRLTRTMLQLGQAAGTAVALAKREQCLVSAVLGDQLRAALHAQGCVLD